MSAASAFQIQVYGLLLGLLITSSLAWFYLLQRYFVLLKSVDESLFVNLGSPDFKQGKFVNDRLLLKHLFSEIKEENKQLKLWHERLRFYFLIYILFFIMVCVYIVLQSFV